VCSSNAAPTSVDSPPRSEITFLSDGGDTVRELQMYLSPQAEHVLDWFHVSMRLQVLSQMAKGLAAEAQIAQALAEGVEEDNKPLKVEELEKSLESLKWNLWQGNVHRALQLVEELEWELELMAERLRQSVAKQGADFDGVRRISSQSGDCEADGEKAADAVDGARRSSTAADPDSCTE